MKLIINAFYCVSLMIILNVVTQAQNWRGLVPLHSSRQDVEKLLGSPSPPPLDGTRFYELHDGRSIYFLDEGEVYIVYANSKVSEWIDCSGKVPDGTLLLIEVTPKKEMRLSDLQLDEKRLKIFNPSEPTDMGYKGYIDEEAGIVVRTYKDRVDEICYFPKAKDRRLCPGYIEDPRTLIEIHVRPSSPVIMNP